jgi:hypothetical protein
MNYIVKNKEELNLLDKLILDGELDYCGENIETLRLNEKSEILVKLREFSHPANFILKLPVQEKITLYKNYKTVYFLTEKYKLEFPTSYEYELKSKDNG